MTNYEKLLDLFFNLTDFLADLCDFIYNILFYHIDLFNCNVLQLLFVLGVGVYVTVFIVKLVRG